MIPKGPSLLTLGISAIAVTIALIGGIALGPTVHAKLDSFRAAKQQEAAEGTWYISQMHPWIIQPEPGQCPICGMDLTPVDLDRFAGEISIDPVIVQNMGVRITPAVEQPIQRELRTVGTVTIDPGRVSDVVQRFDGWVEEIFVTSEWESVAADQPLFRVYAPQITTAEQEWLLAKQRVDAGGEPALLNAAEKKLTLLGLSTAEWQRLRDSGKAADSVVIRANINGVVWAKNVNVGSRIATQTVSYRIVDLSQVWIEATLYEHQLPLIRADQSARVSLNYGEKQHWQGRIDHIYPVVATDTRELRVRFVFDNQDSTSGPVLKPGMFATVFIDASTDDRHVVIPREAVIGTGDRNITFISLGRGKFEPREVQLGPQGSDGLVAIRDGIATGEQVVVSGQFLLDSESKMREALAKVMKGDLASQQAPAAVGNSDELESLPTAAALVWPKLLQAYTQLQNQLYQDNPSPTAITALRQAATTFADATSAGDELARLAQQLHPGEQLKPGFGALSIELDQLLKRFGQAPGEQLVGMRCGMAEGIPEKGVWLQTGSEVRNPYFGAASGMRACAADNWGLPQAGAVSTSSTDHHANHAATTADHSATAAADDDHEKTKPMPPPLDQKDIAGLLQLQQALYQGDLDQAQQAAKALELSSVVTATDLDQARQAYGARMVQLRDQLAAEDTAHPKLKIYRCGMARGVPEKGIWLQAADSAAENPYFGAEHGMSGCFIQHWRITDDGLVELE